MARTDPDDDFRDHAARISKRLADREAALKKASQSPDFGPGQRGEVTVLKREDDLDVVDPPRIKDGEVTQ